MGDEPKTMDAAVNEIRRIVNTYAPLETSGTDALYISYATATEEWQMREYKPMLQKYSVLRTEPHKKFMGVSVTSLIRDTRLQSCLLTRYNHLVLKVASTADKPLTVRFTWRYEGESQPREMMVEVHSSKQSTILDPPIAVFAADDSGIQVECLHGGTMGDVRIVGGCIRKEDRDAIVMSLKR